VENWFKYFLLSLVFAAPSALWAQDEIAQDEVLGKIITPQLDREPDKAADLDQENIELGLFAGFINIEDFGSNAVVGVRTAYHVSERIFVEGTYAQTTVGETSFETLSGTEVLSDEQRNLNYWQVSVAYNLFPGEVFIGKNRAWHSNMYVIAGAGNTSFAENEYFTYSLGGGLQLYPTDWLSVNLSSRVMSFEHEILGEAISTFNLETSFGLAFYF